MFTRGADIAFDGWNLTGYSADRTCTLRIKLIAKFVAKAKTFVASAFAPRAVFAQAVA